MNPKERFPRAMRAGFNFVVSAGDVWIRADDVEAYLTPKLGPDVSEDIRIITLQEFDDEPSDETD